MLDRLAVHPGVRAQPGRCLLGAVPRGVRQPAGDRRDAAALHAADLHRSRAGLRIPRRAVQHRRRGPAVPRRSGRCRRRPVRRRAVVDHRRSRSILFSAALAGAAWAFIPALMKARIGANEVITTMMFSYIGRYFVSWVITGPLMDKGGIPQTPQLPPNSILPRLHVLLPFLKPTRAHTGILLAVLRGHRGLGGAQVHDAGLRGARGRLQPVRILGRRHLGLLDHHQVAVHLGRARRTRRRGRGHGRLRPAVRQLLQRLRLHGDRGRAARQEQPASA